MADDVTDAQLEEEIREVLEGTLVSIAAFNNGHRVTEWVPFRADRSIVFSEVEEVALTHVVLSDRPDEGHLVTLSLQGPTRMLPGDGVRIPWPLRVSSG